MMLMKMRLKAMILTEKLRNHLTDELENQDGITTVEVVLLILVAVGLVLIFKDRITDLVTSIFSKITSQAGKV